MGKFGWLSSSLHRCSTCMLPFAVQDVVFGLLNIKAIQLVGGGARNFQEWFNFLGLIKDKQPTRIGAPYQMDFPGEQNTPAGMSAMNETIPACWNSEFKCSCGDCPDAPACIPVSPSAHTCTSVVLTVPGRSASAGSHRTAYEHHSCKRLMTQTEHALLPLHKPRMLHNLECHECYGSCMVAPGDSKNLSFAACPCAVCVLARQVHLQLMWLAWHC